MQSTQSFASRALEWHWRHFGRPPPGVRGVPIPPPVSTGSGIHPNRWQSPESNFENGGFGRADSQFRARATPISFLGPAHPDVLAGRANAFDEGENRTTEAELGQSAGGTVPEEAEAEEEVTLVLNPEWAARFAAAERRREHKRLTRQALRGSARPKKRRRKGKHSAGATGATGTNLHDHGSVPEDDYADEKVADAEEIVDLAADEDEEGEWGGEEREDLLGEEGGRGAAPAAAVPARSSDGSPQLGEWEEEEGGVGGSRRSSPATASFDEREWPPRAQAQAEVARRRGGRTEAHRRWGSQLGREFLEASTDVDAAFDAFVQSRRPVMWPA